MQIRKRNKNKQERLYAVNLYCRVYTRRDKEDLKLYNYTIYKQCLTYAYNENAAVEKVKKHINTVSYPNINGYEIEFSNIQVTIIDVIDIFTCNAD